MDSGLKNKINHIKLIATDIDGVWTDGTMYYSPEGDVMKVFSTYDGMAVQILRELKIPVAILTGENSPMVRQRAKKLKIPYVFQGEQNKRARLDEICQSEKITLDEIAYIGDDINDLDCLKVVGVTALSGNSPILNQFTPDYVTQRMGGKGAFRDFVDWLLENR
ncbi:MAG: HAD family hydrolase [Candidatus Marinimicrobia bacterium]|nr:HAD family hydrolase [Candidatus Neomarinimicrobiota bacterium]